MIRAGAAMRRAFLLRHLGPLLPVLALLFALEWSSLDFTVSSWFFDPTTGTFPLRYSAALEIFGHQWPRHLVVALACCVIALYLMSFMLPQIEPHRRILLFLSLGLTLAPLAVVFLKAESLRHCPWSLREYGGFAEHLAPFGILPPGASPGHCFPGGHASGGFCLFAFYFAGLALRNGRLQRAGLWGGLTCGLAFGLVRVAQGAHFLSHNLWAGVVCWFVLVLLYVVLVDPSRLAVSGARDAAAS